MHFFEDREMGHNQFIWLLDQRFDFLIDSYKSEYNVKSNDICVVRSYDGRNISKYRVHLVGSVPEGEIGFLEPEQINRLISPELTRIVKDRQLQLVPFSGAYLPSGNNVESIISTGRVAEKFNSKWTQYNFFKERDIKTPETWYVRNIEELRILAKQLLGEHEKLVIKKDELSGGYMMGSVTSEVQIEEYCDRLNEDAKNNEFLISRYVVHEQSFAGMATVGKDGKVRWCGITEQVLYRDFAYEGLIWPPFAMPIEIDQIKRITLNVGEGLRDQGYFGFYNVDFIKGEDGIFAVEINARLGFGAILYGASCGTSFWKAIQGQIKMELPQKPADGKRIILGKIKGEYDRNYSGLKRQDSSIYKWFSGQTSSFKTFYAGTGESEETFKYGSFIGMFGERLDGKLGRKDVLRKFWNVCLSQYGDRKKLLCMYVENYCGIYNTSFNFDANRRYDFLISEVGVEVNYDERNDLPEDFWGNNISAVTLLIGENGSGKTTLMRLLIQWLCKLSVGNIPQEKGGLIIGDGNSVYLIFFEKGELFIDIHFNNGKILTDKKKIKEILNDIELVYYTDTMTDLELEDTLSEEEMKYLTDESLVKRLTRDSKFRLFRVSPKDDLKQREFIRHMEMFLENRNNIEWEHEFPLRFIRLSVSRKGESNYYQQLNELNLREYNIPEIVERLSELLVPDTDFRSNLIGAALADMIIAMLLLASLIGHENNLNETDSCIQLVTFFITAVNYIEEALIKGTSSDKIIFLENLIDDLNREIKDNTVSKKYKKESDQIASAFKSFFKALLQNDDSDNFFFLGFIEDKNESSEKEIVYKLCLDDLENNGTIEQWAHVWTSYIGITSYLPDFVFKWHYGSSGENNRGAFYDILSAGDRIIGRKKNVWFILDEIDNAYHPEWKRKGIYELVEACSNKHNTGLSFQLLLSTHSPIMLSDSPKAGGIYLKKKDGKKAQESVLKSTFGQQIYELFNEAFFMEKGIIGSFAEKKISTYYNELRKIERSLKKSVSKKKFDEYSTYLSKNEYMLRLIDEPILKGHLTMANKVCRRLLSLSTKDIKKDDQA